VEWVVVWLWRSSLFNHLSIRLQVDSTKAAEVLVSQLEMEARIQEALATNSKTSPQRLLVFEVELDRIRSQAAHLRSQVINDNTTVLWSRTAYLFGL